MYRSVVDWWSVCHVRALCSNGRRYRHDFFYTRQLPCLSQIVLKIMLAYIVTSVNPFLPKFSPKVTHPLLIWVSENLSAYCVRMVRDSAIVTLESLQETTIALSNGTEMVPSRTPRPSPFSKIGSQMHTANDVAFRQITCGHFCPYSLGKQNTWTFLFWTLLLVANDSLVTVEYFLVDGRRFVLKLRKLWKPKRCSVMCAKLPWKTLLLIKI